MSENAKRVTITRLQAEAIVAAAALHEVEYEDSDSPTDKEHMRALESVVGKLRKARLL